MIILLKIGYYIAETARIRQIWFRKKQADSSAQPVRRFPVVKSAPVVKMPIVHNVPVVQKVARAVPIVQSTSFEKPVSPPGQSAEDLHLERLHQIFHLR